MRSLYKIFSGLILLAVLPALAKDYAVDAAGETPHQPSPRVMIFPSEESAGSYLGIDSEDISPDRVGPLKLKEERGVEVLMVDQDGPAGKAGLKEHDVILEFNGTRVEGVEQLRRLIHEVPPGRTVTLGISRDGQPLTLQALLADRKRAMSKGFVQDHNFKFVVPSTPQVPVMPDIEMPAFDFVIQTSSRAGILVENLTPQLGDYFGVKNGQGVLVRSVEKGSPAEAAGVKAGDVIVRVENERIASRSDWKMALRGHGSGKVTLGIVRDKREMSLPLTLPARKPSDTSSLRDFDIPDVEFEFDGHHINFDRAKVEEMNRKVLQASQKLRASQKQIQHAVMEAQTRIQRELAARQKSLQKDLDRMQRELQKTLE